MITDQFAGPDSGKRTTATGGHGVRDTARHAAEPAGDTYPGTENLGRSERSGAERGDASGESVPGQFRSEHRGAPGGVNGPGVACGRPVSTPDSQDPALTGK